MEATREETASYIPVEAPISSYRDPYGPLAHNPLAVGLFTWASYYLG